MEAQSKSHPKNTESDWYKCGLCQYFLHGPAKLLTHLADHRAPGPQLFYSKGFAVKIEELSNSYDMFTPKIEIRPFENICRKSRFELRPCKIQLERLSESQIKGIQDDLSKRKLRKRPPRPVVDAFLANEGEEDPEDFNWMPNEDLADDDTVDIEFSTAAKKRKLPMQKRRIENSTSQGKASNSVKNLGQKIVDGYPCKYCGKIYNYEHRLIPHVKLHESRNARNAVKPFQCTLCREGFTQKYHLKRHFLKHMENNPFICDFPGCGHRSTTAKNLESHVRRHFAKNLFCSICSREFVKQSSLNAHMLRIHPNGETIVPKRKERTAAPKRRLLQGISYGIAPEDLALPALRSLGIEIQQNRFELDSIHLGDPSTIKAEAEQALADVKEELEQLENSANSNSNTDQALRSDEDEKWVPDQDDSTSDSDSETTAKSNPRKAVVDLYAEAPVVQSLAKENPEFVKLLVAGDGNGSHTTGGNHGAFTCKICTFPQMSYPRIRFLKEHMLKHHPEVVETEVPTTVSLACDQCGFQCDTTRKLARHRKTHGTLKAFRCVECGYTFPTQERLEIHIQRIHRQERKFKCDECTKKFLTRTDVVKHKQRVHESVVDIEVSPYICKVCGKKTRNEVALKAHSKLHDKNRVFCYCQICNEKLSNKASLKRHIQLIHVNPGPFLLPAPERKPNIPCESNIFL